MKHVLPCHRPLCRRERSGRQTASRRVRDGGRSAGPRGLQDTGAQHPPGGIKTGAGTRARNVLPPRHAPAGSRMRPCRANCPRRRPQGDAARAERRPGRRSKSAVVKEEQSSGTALSGICCNGKKSPLSRSSRTFLEATAPLRRFGSNSLRPVRDDRRIRWHTHSEPNRPVGRQPPPPTRTRQCLKRSTS
jgi:hypothetical protein